MSVGPLADRVFEPLLAPEGALAGSVGAFIGTGAGRGMGFMCVVLGALGLLGSLFAAATPALRDLESNVPDADASAVDDAVAAEATGRAS